MTIAHLGHFFTVKRCLDIFFICGIVEKTTPEDILHCSEGQNTLFCEI